MTYVVKRLGPSMLSDFNQMKMLKQTAAENTQALLQFAALQPQRSSIAS